MIWVRHLHYPQTSPTSLEGMLLMSRMTLPTPLIPCLWVSHSCHMTMAISTVQLTWEELDQKPLSSPWLPLEPIPSLGGCPPKWITLITGSEYRWAGKESTLISGNSLKLFTGGCLVGDLRDTHTLQLAWWQATAFRLPPAQEEASGWWEAPYSLSTLHHGDFLLWGDSPTWGTSTSLGRRKP